MKGKFARQWPAWAVTDNLKSYVLWSESEEFDPESPGIYAVPIWEGEVIGFDVRGAIAYMREHGLERLTDAQVRMFEKRKQRYYKLTGRQRKRFESGG